MKDDLKDIEIINQSGTISDIEKIFISNNCNITFSGYINYKHGTSAVVRATKK